MRDVKPTRLPIRGAFRAATCRLDDDATWERFERTLLRRGRAHQLAATLTSEDLIVAEFQGSYVAIGGAAES